MITLTNGAEKDFPITITFNAIRVRQLAARIGTEGGMMFRLDERLALCASFVRDGTKLADIGTDHAYLPVWLAKNGKIVSAVAADIRPKPLENAKENIRRYNAENMVSTVLSDGLDEIEPSQAQDIVIAGMGGELIAKIIDRPQWLYDSSRRLILQPMTRAESLRLFLCEKGFKTEQEKACISGGKTYSVMVCSYDGKVRECSNEFKYAGLLLNDNSSEAKQYIYNVKEKLKKKINAYDENSAERAELSALIEKFEKIINT